MKAILHRSELRGEVEAPPSKSYTHRAIAVASLSACSCEIERPLICEDTKATIRAAKAIGAEVEYDARRMRVEGVERLRTPDDVIYAANSGTTLRFFTAICSLCEGAAVLTGDASLRRRTNKPLLKALNDLGAEAFSTKGDGTAPLVVRGRLRGGETEIDGSVSSQFASALLIACPRCENDSRIAVRNAVSVPYMRMTLEVLRAASAEIPFICEANDFIFEISGGQRYALKHFKVPGDFSSASYILAAAVLTGSSVAVRNLEPSEQGDVKILEILREMGAEVSWNKEAGVVHVRDSGKLEGISVDLRENPDLAPTVAVLGAFAEGRTEIKGVGHLRHKETDRISTLATELRKLGVSAEEREDGLLISSSGAKAVKSAVKLDAHGDHRLAMALCVAALRTGGEVSGVESVSISYPEFFEHLAALGADFELK